MSKKRIALKESLENFMPDNGQTYVNGSFRRGPVYDYEWDSVMAEAEENAKKQSDNKNDK